MLVYATNMLFISRIGGMELVVIVLLIVVLFGTKKIPELMKGVGRGMREFKEALNTDYSVEEKKENNAKKEITEGQREAS